MLRHTPFHCLLGGGVISVMMWPEQDPTTYLCNAYCIFRYFSSVLLVYVGIVSRNGANYFTSILSSGAVEFIHHDHKMCEPTNPFLRARVLNEVNVMIRYDLSDY